MEITESQKKYIILALSILCTAMLLLTIITVIGRVGKTAVSFVASPDETQIEFNNQKITGSRTIYLKPGTYSFKATRNGFREKIIQTMGPCSRPVHLRNPPSPPCPVEAW